MAKTPVKTAPRARRGEGGGAGEFQEIAAERAAARETADRKGEEARVLREAEVRESVEGVTVEGVVDGVSKLGLEITKSLAEISGQLSGAVRMLATVREAVVRGTGGVGTAATGLTWRRRLWTNCWRITGRRRRAWRRRSPGRKAAWKREADDFEYNKALERKRAQDRYSEEQRQLERKNAEKQETLEKSWAVREAGAQRERGGVQPAEEGG